MSFRTYIALSALLFSSSAFAGTVTQTMDEAQSGMAKANNDYYRALRAKGRTVTPEESAALHKSIVEPAQQEMSKVMPSCPFFSCVFIFSVMYATPLSVSLRASLFTARHLSVGGRLLPKHAPLFTYQVFWLKARFKLIISLFSSVTILRLTFLGIWL